MLIYSGQKICCRQISCKSLQYAVHTDWLRWIENIRPYPLLHTHIYLFISPHSYQIQSYLQQWFLRHSGIMIKYFPSTHVVVGQSVYALPSSFFLRGQVQIRQNLSRWARTPLCQLKKQKVCCKTEQNVHMLMLF